MIQEGFLKASKKEEQRQEETLNLPAVGKTYT